MSLALDSGCLKDANINQNMCGPTARATCTGSHSPGMCCAATGWCGSTDSHCGDGMQAEYSHSRGLCDSAVLEIAQQEEEENFDSNTSQCVSMQQIANATRSAEKEWASGKRWLQRHPPVHILAPWLVRPKSWGLRCLLSPAGLGRCYTRKVGD